MALDNTQRSTTKSITDPPGGQLLQPTPSSPISPVAPTLASSRNLNDINLTYGSIGDYQPVAPGRHHR